MTSLLMAFVGVLLAPLFIGKWRASLMGLACQGVLMAWIAYRLGVHPGAPAGLVTLIDLALIRGLVAPILLYRVLRGTNAPARNDVISPNLLSWTFAFGIVLMAFAFARALVPEGGEPKTLVGVATSALMLGFLVLASQAGVFSQIVGALRFENAIALFELGGPAPTAVVAAVGQSLIVIVTILFYRWHLAHRASAPGVEETASTEGPTI